MNINIAKDPPAGASHTKSSAVLARAAMIRLAERKLAPTPENYAQAWIEAGGEAVHGREHDENARRMRRAERLAAELTEMVKTLCTTISVVADSESWVKGQGEALREMLDGEIDHVSVSELRALLTQTVGEQRKIAEQRRKALEQLKATIVELAGVLGGVLDSTDQFSQKITEHASEIEGAVSVAALTGTVQRLLTDTREMKLTVGASREGLRVSHSVTAALGREVSRLEAKLAAASAEVVTDHLTQTMNRRGLEGAFHGAVERARQTGRSLSLALIDVDDFKKLNDALGHHAGDGALKHLATLLKEKLRPTDAVARYGGEEFVIVLPGANLSDAQETIVRTQRELTTHVFMYDEQRRFITFSGGVTEVRPEDTLESAVARADDAMYQAKHDGKNCVRAI